MPDPEPSPAPTAAFATEEEAFAAAEEVYRAYNDAGNARIRGEAEPNPQAFLEGVALENDVDAQNSFREWGLRADGEAIVTSFRGTEANVDDRVATVTSVVCIDVSALRVLNADGVDVTPADRGDVVSQLVQFTGDQARLRISVESSADGASC
ncbi:hypothetical protein AB0N61_00795 [Microbacterium sp. NPDC089320]|uniref:hypothetical protein n=1 Tax=Microbacterium sp. NPDC089320 TaxID=3155182 RepID=UPI0034320C52